MSLKIYSHFCRWCVFIGHEYTLLDSSKSVYTSPAATVYLCQLSSKLQDELFIQCADGKVEVIILITLINSSETDSPVHKSSSTF